MKVEKYYVSTPRNRFIKAFDEMSTKKFLVVVLLTMLLVLGTVTAVGIYTKNLPSEATIPYVEITTYSNSLCTDELDYLNWTDVQSGINNLTVYVRNTGNCSVTLTLTTTNLPMNWTLTWDYDNSSISIDSSIEIELTLAVPEDALAETYYWTTEITAEGV